MVRKENELFSIIEQPSRAARNAAKKAAISLRPLRSLRNTPRILLAVETV